MKLAPIGKRLVIIFFIIFALSVILSFWFLWLGIPLSVISFVLCVFSLYFFRDPDRPKVFAPDEIACPADGRIMSVGNEGTEGITVVRIFLSIFNVHVQRAPVAGTVDETKYTKGTFFSAFRKQAAETNEKNLISVTGSDGRKVQIEQITGSIARRIECYVRKSQTVTAGERVGIIYFGSQVAVYLPESAKIAVKPGDKVSGAETILAKW